MLLDDFLESSIIQLCELGQIMDICYDVAQVFLQQLKILFCGGFVRVGSTGIFAVGFQNHVMDLLLGRSDPPNDLLALDFLKVVHFIELPLQFLDKALLGLLVPWLVNAQGVFEVVVGDVVEGPVLDERRLELLAEPERADVELAKRWGMRWRAARRLEERRQLRHLCSSQLPGEDWFAYLILDSARQ